MSDGPQRACAAELAYQQAACGLLTTDPQGRILRVNATLCGWLGFDERELLASRLQNLLTMGSRIFHQTHWAPLLEIQGSIAEVKFEMRRKDGKPVPVILNAVRRTLGGERHDDVAVFIVVDRHKYEQELVRARGVAEQLLQKNTEAQAALGDAQAQLFEESARQRAAAEDRALFAEQMMGIVSHDLRNPLSVVSLSGHVIGRGPLDDRQRDALARIRTATARADRLIADLLDFTQARLGGGLSVKRRPLALHAFVEDLVTELRIAYPKRALVHVSEGEGAGDADADRLSQLLGNLVANAITYGDPETEVRVTSRVLPRFFELSVRNGGEPIPASVLATLFEPMVRGPGVQAVGRSIGLGLYIVREIARAHGGDVAATSTAADGTTFVVSLPR
ncbi:MAG: PAS domain-containing sensor histidine kinase [Burkholderiaceae bacterium]